MDEALLVGLEAPILKSIVMFLANAIASANRLETVVSSGDDAAALMIELSSLLKEIACPFEEFEKDAFAAIQVMESRLDLIGSWLCHDAFAFKSGADIEEKERGGRQARARA